MQTNTLNFQSLSFYNYKTFVYSFLFIIGNIALPQICHLIPDGGFIFLPIYFFTLVSAYKYGWKVGMLVAIGSPLANHLLFGMPPAVVLPSILIKSSLLAVSAAYVARRFRSITIPLLVAVVLAYQVFGSLIESALTSSFTIGFQDFRIGIPGMILQIIGGYLVIRYILRGKTSK